MYVKPTEGRAPRDPNSNLRVPPEGQLIPDHDAGWAMLLRFGDVEEADAPSDQPDKVSPASTVPANEEHA